MGLEVGPLHDLLWGPLSTVEFRGTGDPRSGPDGSRGQRRRRIEKGLLHQTPSVHT